MSEDKTQCEYKLRTDRLIAVNFGYKETTLRTGMARGSEQCVRKFQRGSSEHQPDNRSRDTDTKTKLAALKAGDIVVGSAGGAISAQIVSTQKSVMTITF
ncbi:MAG: hypothetical protein R2941_21000 [Desulfobacterales bacterium]